MIAVLDYGMGNIHSCLKAISHFTKDFIYTKDPEVLQSADALILPGDGHFDKAMHNLNESGLRKYVDGHVQSGKPLFGICIGYQILFEDSDETVSGNPKELVQGLGYIKGKVRKFRGKNYKVPHIGWNRLYKRNPSKSVLLNGLDDESFVYFIHSYRPVDVEGKAVSGLCDYYGERFPAVVEKGNIFGTQFHPEKSHTYGLKILENFIRSL
ncbi:imidazole glycerol phosphate synthase subunit HisH [Leptospira wolffii]|uniref:Imidazole glycerol phosphate synthase subunit HisH n=1 Tax=Leptospira wolffii TaxID=409998 RepID=A0ABV5BP10_9LEPT|nr:imidazole glycerol phosphate synthase subunit HisH [Leptospira wolffii]EPG65459.1 imidazole glycerol phosphate synthase, glutamine amidotransferase subunit [Leptospira wolffii serovar Khorat str. Khorat-H2]TGK61830.1 imidazole glycerol phosphate synthase subunit HisH [Leptospira wolffii]TGK65917.1 imidazole glycerol phosphate synthase subunit HisH [Leptospira wolffii]TGK74786.1 imidazole glycerol phosphate synthase subunit HisH [Leptospira wolffii]TGL30852.1 imidazole glycerol phosphate syn